MLERRPRSTGLALYETGPWPEIRSRSASGTASNELVWLWRFWAARVKNKLSARPAGYSHGHIRYPAHFALVCYPVPPHIQDVGSRKSELCSALAFRSAKFTVRLKSVPTVTDHETISACLTAIFTKSL